MPKSAQPFTDVDQLTRMNLAFDASAAIETLTNVLLREVDSNKDELEILRFTNIVTHRIHSLNSLIMSVVGVPDRSIEQLQEILRG